MKNKMMWCLAAMLILGTAACHKKTETEQAPVAPVAADSAQNAANTTDTNANAQTEPVDPEIEKQANAMADDIMAKIGQQQIPAPEDVAAPPADAQKTPSGLAYKKLTVNDAGNPIGENDFVKLHYTGWTTDGKMFDSSVISGIPATFSLKNLIPGMKEAIMLAKTGEKMRVWIPQELAYDGKPGVPAGMLVFDFDVLENVTPVMPPKDIPEDAIKFEIDNPPLPPGIQQEDNTIDKEAPRPQKVELAYRIVKTNPGARQLGGNDFVTLEFAGWTQNDEKLFHSTLEGGEPLAAPVDSMFTGWREILPKVHDGDTVQMWLPQEAGIDPLGKELKGMLIFTVTIAKSVQMPSTPDDVAAPPADAEKTESGLASKVLQPGYGTEHPKAQSIVSVNYTGWTTDGNMFDSSIIHGHPISFPLNHVIAGWTEGVQLMVVGEKRRFWIPEELAYKGQPGAPAGMLVFDVELLDVADAPEPAPMMPPMGHDHEHDHGDGHDHVH